MAHEALNAVCPYYTMFPLSFPLRVIGKTPPARGWIADPFCGRGTTNLAARLRGASTFGIDSSPIAVAIAAAKLAKTTAKQVEVAATRILEGEPEPRDIPSGEFWRRMYHSDVLFDLCRMREALLRDCRSDVRIMLRAILLGALHGPRTKTVPSHLSNQSPRTYAPKPAYAVRFWRERQLQPPRIDLLEVIRVRAARYLAETPSAVGGTITLGDSRRAEDYPSAKVGLVITSPPYYGMRTYIPDQWLRHWLLGGPASVDYRHPADEIQHSSPSAFASELRLVWKALAEKAVSGARMVVRFGSINDRDVDHVHLLKESLNASGWVLRTIKDAGDASTGRRQATQFRLADSAPRIEHDFYAVLG